MKCTWMVIFCLLGFVPAAWADGVSGVVMVVRGQVSIVSQNGSEVRARVGARVHAHDTIIAGKDSRAKIVMSDKNIINISPDTRMSFAQYINNPSTNQRQVLLNVLYGKVRSTVNQKYDGNRNTFRVKTPTAVAGVRGTDFMASYNSATQLSKIVTFSGLVEVGQTNLNGMTINVVKVAPGQMTTVSPSHPPTPPTILPTNQLRSLNQNSKTDAAVVTPTNNVEKPVASDSQAGSSSSQSRAPATTTAPTVPVASSSSMLDHSDLGPDVTAPGFNSPINQVPPPPPNFTPVAPPAAVTPPACAFCNTTIANGQSHVNVQIRLGP